MLLLVLHWLYIHTYIFFLTPILESLMETLDCCDVRKNRLLLMSWHKKYCHFSQLGRTYGLGKIKKTWDFQVSTLGRILYIQYIYVSKHLNNIEFFFLLLLLLVWPGVTGFLAQDNTGHFGPFQSCRYTAYYSFCGGSHYYRNTGTFGALRWLLFYLSHHLYHVIATFHNLYLIRNRSCRYVWQPWQLLL